MINGGENSHDLPSAKGRPMKAGGIIQSEFEGLRTRGANGVNPSLGQEQMRGPSLSSETGKKEIPPSSAFCCIEALSGLNDAPSHWRGPSPLPSPQSRKESSSPGIILIDTPRNNV